MVYVIYMYVTTCTCKCINNFINHLVMNLQQDEILAELKEYACNDPKPQDAQAVELVISYLDALNL